MSKILVINGPNLNMLGQRKKEHYGQVTYLSLCDMIKRESNELGYDIEFFQSNHEGEIIDCLHNAIDYAGIIINPGAFTHYSYAIADALEIVDLPIIEVHLSNIHSRESFRKESVTAKNVDGQIAGFKEHSYTLAVNALDKILKSK